MTEIEASDQIAAELAALGNNTETGSLGSTKLTQNQQQIFDVMTDVFNKVERKELTIETITLQTMEDMMKGIDMETYETDHTNAVNAFTISIKDNHSEQEIQTILKMFENIEDYFTCHICMEYYNDGTKKKFVLPCHPLHIVCEECRQLLQSCPFCRADLPNLLPKKIILPSPNDSRYDQLIKFTELLGSANVTRENIERILRVTDNLTGHKHTGTTKDAACHLISTMNTISNADHKLRSYFEHFNIYKKYLKTDIFSCIIKALRRLCIGNDWKDLQVLKSVFISPWNDLTNYNLIYNKIDRTNNKNLSIQKIELAICRYMVSSGLDDEKFLLPTREQIGGMTYYELKNHRLYFNVLDDRIVYFVEFYGFTLNFLRVTEGKMTPAKYNLGLDQIERYYTQLINAIQITHTKICKLQSIEKDPLVFPSFDRIKLSMFMALNICVELSFLLNDYSVMGIAAKYSRRDRILFIDKETHLKSRLEQIFTGLGIQERTWQRGGSEKFGARLAIAAGLATIVASAFLQ
jgi:hypothetical protein